MKPLFAATWRLLAIILVGLVPFLALASAIGWHDVIKISIYGFFVCVLATITYGVRTGVQLTLIFVVLTTAGACLQHSVAGTAAIVGLSAVLVPIYGVRGRLQAGTFAAMFLPNALNPPPQPWQGAEVPSFNFAVAIAAVTLLGGLWGLLIGNAVRSKLPALPGGPTIPPRAAAVGGVLLVLTAAGVAYFSMTHFPHAKWAWLLTAVYSMITAASGLSLKSSWEMIFGTAVGSGAAVVLLFSSPSTGIALIAGTVLLSASMGLKLIGKPPWLAVSVSTAGVIFLTASSMDPFIAAEDRLLFTVAGSAIAVLLGAVITWAVRTQEPANATARVVKSAI